MYDELDRWIHEIHEWQTLDDHWQCSLHLFISLCAGFGLSSLGQATRPVTVAAVLSQAIPGFDAKEVRMITVEYAPGAASPPHHHPASVFAYVLKGSVASQVGDGSPVTYHTGEAFYETPNQPDLISKNASGTEPAKMLVFALIEKGQRLTLPFTGIDRRTLLVVIMKDEITHLLSLIEAETDASVNFLSRYVCSPTPRAASSATTIYRDLLNFTGPGERCSVPSGFTVVTTRNR